LRQRFLGNAYENYWKDRRELELYDSVYAQRIAWKWSAVLQNLSQVGWSPTSSQVIDWGCGTGIAARTVTAWSGIKQVRLFDQSPLALAFAQEALIHEGIEATKFSPDKSLGKNKLLLISHVLSELQEEESQELANLAATADEIIWVEPGSHDISRMLGSLRSIFIEAGHHLIAPCVYENSCPMLQPKHERDWCHFFAQPPSEIFQSSFWHEASRQLSIDLRSLPYSYLAFSRSWKPSHSPDTERLIAHPRALKAHGKLLCCGSSGLCERSIQKRDNPALFKRLIKNQEEGAFAWKLDSSELILDAQKIF